MFVLNCRPLRALGPVTDAQQNADFIFMLTFTPLVLIITVIAGLLLISSLIVQIRIAERPLAVREFGLAHGFTYNNAFLWDMQIEAICDEYDNELQEYLKELASLLDLPVNKGHLFIQGKERCLYNILHKRIGAVDQYVFDYEYSLSTGQHSSIISQIVVRFKSDSFDFPQFVMVPRTAVASLGPFMRNYISFPHHPHFAKNYRLASIDEPVVRALFDQTTVRFFEKHKLISVESLGDELLVYRESHPLSRYDLAYFIRTADQVLRLFRNSQSRLPKSGT